MFENILQLLCLNDTILLRDFNSNITNDTTNIISKLPIINDCFLQLVLLIPTTILFVFLNSYHYGLNNDLSRHISSFRLRLYRSISIVIILDLLVKVILNYSLTTNDRIKSPALLCDLFQLICFSIHANLLFNKNIFKNLNFKNYPISLLLTLLLVFLSNFIYLINQAFKYVYIDIYQNELIILYSTKKIDLNLINVILNSIFNSFLFGYLILIIISYKLNDRNRYNQQNIELTSDEDKANYNSYITINWLKNVMQKGYKRELNTIEQLAKLPFDLNINKICKRFMNKYTNDSNNIDENPIINPELLIQERINNEASMYNDEFQVQYQPQSNIQYQERISKRTLISALMRCFGKQFLLLGIIKLLNDALNFSGPLLLNKLVEFIEINSTSLKIGCMYAGALFISSLISSILNTHFTYSLNKLCLQIKSALIGLIYTKTVQIQLNELNNYSIGQIVNFMSIDSDSVVNAFPSIHAFWSLPFQILITLYLLYQQIGLSFLVGLAFVIILIPINKVISDYIGRVHQNLMKFKDSRVKASIVCNFFFVLKINFFFLLILDDD